MATKSVYTPQEVTSMMNLIDTYIRWRTVDTRGDRSYDHFHPSEMGKCLRMQQYKHYAWKGLIDVKYPEPESQKHRLFDKGHNMHDRWSNYFDQIGNILLGRWKCKNTLCFMFDDDGQVKKDYSLEDMYKKKKTRIAEGKNGPIFKPEKCKCGCSDFEYLETHVRAPQFNIKGNADIVLNCRNLKEERFKGVRTSYNPKYLPVGKSKVVIDMKSIGSNPWKNQIMSKGAHKDYLIQLTIYIHVLGCDYGIIAYENKDNSKMAWFHVPRNDIWWEIIQSQALTMMDMAKEKKLPPPKYDSKKNFSCSYCDFKSLCHKSKVWDSPTLDSNRKEFYKSLL
jgi:hypothetical protein